MCRSDLSASRARRGENHGTAWSLDASCLQSSAGAGAEGNSVRRQEGMTVVSFEISVWTPSSAAGPYAGTW